MKHFLQRTAECQRIDFFRLVNFKKIDRIPNFNIRFSKVSFVLAARNTTDRLSRPLNFDLWTLSLEP